MELTNLLFIGGIGLLEIIFILIFLATPIGLVIWAIIDLLSSQFTDSTNKLIWALVIIFVPVIGSILYLIMGRKQKINSTNR
jgi:hypothetical protein